MTRKDVFTPAPQAPGVKECCRNIKNLMRISTDPYASVDKCLVCGCRHFRARMAGLKIGLKGS